MAFKALHKYVNAIIGSQEWKEMQSNEVLRTLAMA
jgi:hypothetical protein